MPYEIVKNVPLPNRLRGRSHSYDFHEMEIGDSFYVPTKNGLASEKSKVRRKIRQAAYLWNKHNGSKCEFVYEYEDDGVRCWRLK